MINLIQCLVRLDIKDEDLSNDSHLPKKKNWDSLVIQNQYCLDQKIFIDRIIDDLELKFIKLNREN